MRILTIGVPLGKAQKRTYVTPAPGAALRLPRVVDATCRRQTQNTVPLRTMCISLSIIHCKSSDIEYMKQKSIYAQNLEKLLLILHLYFNLNLSLTESVDRTK